MVVKGKKLDEFRSSVRPPKELVDAMLGPTGNLRAPCLKVGKILLVGFNAEVYSEVFGV